MRLSRIQISNFKSIGDTVDLQVSKLNLLFGNNSNGKSSILQALHLADEVLNERSGDPDATRMGSEYVRLGGFERFVHGRDCDRTVKVRLTFSCKDHEFRGWEPHDFYAWIDSYPELEENCAKYTQLISSKRDVDPSEIPGEPPEGAFLGGFYILEPIASFSVTFSIGVQGLSSMSWDVNEHEYLTLSNEVYATDSGDQLTGLKGQVNVNHPILPDFLLDSMEWAKAPRYPILNFDDDLNVIPFDPETREVTTRERRKYWSELVSSAHGRTSSGWKQRLEQIKVSNNGFLRFRIDATLNRDYMLLHLLLADANAFDLNSSEMELQLRRADLGTLAAYTTAVQVHLWEAAAEWLGHAIHIGPLRDPIDLTTLGTGERLEYSAASKQGNWFDGTAAWHTLAGRGVYEQSRAEESTRQECPTFLEQVNNWMAGESRFGMGIELHNTDFAIAEEATEKIDVVLPRSLIHELLRIVRRHGRIGVLSLINNLGEAVSSREIGVGYSQLLPIVVAALLERTNGVFLLEQPELHIHAHLQAVLGDLLIWSSKRNGTQFFIETHSEYLLLRLMRRIRESRKELEISGPRLYAEDVGLHRVWIEGGQTRVSMMPLDEYGNLTVEWPDNLLEISYREAFGK